MLEDKATGGTCGCTATVSDSPPRKTDYSFRVPPSEATSPAARDCAGHLEVTEYLRQSAGAEASLLQWLEPAPRDGRCPGPGCSLAETEGTEHTCRRVSPRRGAHLRSRCAAWARAHRREGGSCRGPAHKGGARRLEDWPPDARAAWPPRTSKGRGGQPRATRRGMREQGPPPPHAMVRPAPPAGRWRMVPPTRARSTNLVQPREGARRGRGARRGHAFSCIVMRRESRAAGGGAWLGRKAGAGPATARPRPAPHPRSAGHAPHRGGAGAGRGRGQAGSAPAVNIDAARVGVALLPLSEAVSRGPASA